LTNRNIGHQIGAPLSDKKIIHIDANSHNSLVVTSDGLLFTFGNNTDGQLGIGESGVKTLKNAPVQVTALKGRNIVSATCGVAITLAITADGGLYSFGKK